MSDEISAPTVDDIVVQPVSDGVWRVKDSRLPEHDALCVLGVIERIEGVFEALQVGHGLKRGSFASLNEAVPFFAHP